MSATCKSSEPPLVEVLAPEHGRSVSPALEEAQHPQVAAANDDDETSSSAEDEAAPPEKVPSPPPLRRGIRSRAMSATSRAVRAALRFLLQLVVFVVFATLRLLQLAAFALTAVGLPYTLSGPATVLALLSTAAILVLKVPIMMYGVVPRITWGRATIAAADTALLALAGAMLADHCGCRGGAPLPAPVYKAVRRASLSSLHLVHAAKLKPAELAYRAYCTACDLIC